MSAGGGSIPANTSKKRRENPGFLKIRKDESAPWSYFPSHSSAVHGTPEFQKLKHPLQRINGVLDENKRDKTIAGFQVVTVSRAEYEAATAGTPASSYCPHHSEGSVSTTGGVSSNSTSPERFSHIDEVSHSSVTTTPVFTRSLPSSPMSSSPA